MVELEPRPIPAQAQLLAVAWLRWRIFVNNFRRRSSDPRKLSGLVFTIVLRIIGWSFLVLFFIGPVVGSGLIAWLAVSKGHTDGLPWLLAALFLGWQYVTMQGATIAATTLSFDPSTLIRFPLPFPRYLTLRLLIGLLTPTTLCGCFALLAVAIGVGIARHALFVPALLAMAVYALMNIIFARMVGVWIERWLATRRAREIFGLVTLLFIVATQLLNLHNSSHHGRLRGNPLQPLIHHAAPVLRWLPPGCAADGIVSAHAHALRACVDLAAVLACSAIFLAIFAARLRKEFHGEYLSDSAARSIVKKQPRRIERPVALKTSEETADQNLHRSSALSACLRKECRYLIGNTRQYISLMTSLFFAFILSSSHGLLGRHPSYLLSGAIAYVLLGPLGALFNIFGADGAGAQLYFLAPVRAGTVVLAKNFASLLLIIVEVVLTWIVILFRVDAPIPLATQVATGIWVVFVLFANLALGSLRSIQAPRRFTPGQPRQTNRPGRQTSGLLVIGVLLSSLLLQVPVTMLCHRLGNPWLASAIFAPCALLALGAYGLLLYRADELMQAHREVFAEELCKA